ncbi:glycosyltransferase [Desulfitibacter alkalitolerans]|uniref:glycosyltransferase n=1 Tax=Desulfitibacter alkalitolerans TaxID=264641 RepID=UPI000685AFCA|nr:glycosyltransferase [Desulfitibacter alkalitolerans]
MLSVSRFLEDQKIIRRHDEISNPQVSVIMPTYCRGEISLRRAIESVLKQTFHDFEFIIIDDGSKDGTFNILKEYQEKDNRIVIIRHNLNSGLPALRVNEGILIARGKYISYQFDDDEYLSECLEILYDYINKQYKPCLVYGTCSIEIKSPDGSIKHSYLGKSFNYGLLMNGNYIANNSVMHNKEIFNRCGLYDPHVLIRRYSDYDLWLRMAKHVPFYWIDKVVTNVYAGEQSSLGVEVDYKLSYIRKYLEIPREAHLSEAQINQYEVDNVEIYFRYFNSIEKDYLKRYEIIPYRNLVPYYIKDIDTYTSSLSRIERKTIAVTKSDFSTSIDVTIKNFIQRIKGFPYKSFYINEASLSALELDDYDILILYRTIGQISLQTLHKNKSFNKPAIYLMDDNMFKFHELGTEFSYIAPATEGFRNLKQQVEESDLVISYNSIITDDCQRYNAKVIELRTNIPGEYLDTCKEIDNFDVVKIAIFSGPVRTQELKELWPVLQEISKKYSKRIELHFWGINPHEFGELNCPVIYEEFTHSYDYYLRKLYESSFHYHICPLKGDKDASLSKSPVKFLEGTVAGAVGIFSNVKPYNSIPENMCLKVNNTNDEWYKTIDEAINLEPASRQELFNNAKAFILTNFSTESQVCNLISALEAGVLHARLKEKQIAYFFHESYLGGATLHLLKHALILKKHGFKIILCLPSKNKHVDELQKMVAKYGLDITFHEYDPSVNLIMPTKKDIEDSDAITQWILNNNVGLIHSVTVIPAVGLASKQANIPHVATLHQFYQSQVSEDYPYKSRLIDIIHSSSLFYARKWSERLKIPAKRIVCPVDDIYFEMYKSNTHRQRNLKNKINVLVSGTIQERKNQLNAIIAVNLLTQKGYKIELNIIGYDNLCQEYVSLCKQAVIDKHLNTCVRVHGFTNQPKIYYQTSDILLCCSLDESMPQTVLQAMAAGVMVVSTKVGGIKEIVKDYYNGIIAKGSDALSIAEAIEKVILMESTDRIQMAENAHKTIKMIGTSSFVASELLNIYNEAFEQSRKGLQSEKSYVPNTISPAIKLQANQLKNKNHYLKESMIPNIYKSKTILCGSPPITNGRIYNIIAKHDSLCGLKIMIGTHGFHCKGVLSMELSSPNKPNVVLRRVEMNTESLVDNQEVELCFEPISNSQNKEFIVKFKYSNVSNNEILSIYEYAVKNSFLDRVKYRLIFNNTYSLYGSALYNC